MNSIQIGKLFMNILILLGLTLFCIAVVLPPSQIQTTLLIVSIFCAFWSISMKIKGSFVCATRMYMPEYKGVEAEIELSAEDLAKQLSEQGYYFRCFECGSTQLLFEKKNKPTEPEKCECKEPKRQYYSPNVPNWCMNCGKPIAEKKGKHYPDCDWLKCGHSEYFGCENKQYCPKPEPPKRIEELHIKYINSPKSHEIVDKINECIRRINLL